MVSLTIRAPKMMKRREDLRYCGAKQLFLVITNHYICRLSITNLALSPGDGQDPRMGDDLAVQTVHLEQTREEQ